MSLQHEICRINPVRFRCANFGEIDFDDFYPNFDQMQLNEQYIAGEYSINKYVDWKAGETMNCQIHANSTQSPKVNLSLYNLDTGATISGTVTEITPVGYVGYDVWKLSVTPPSEGKYIIIFDIENEDPSDPEDTAAFFYYSDPIKAHTQTTFEDGKRLVQLKYKNNENSLGVIWDDYYTAYYTAKFEEGDGELESTVFKTDTGVNKQNSVLYNTISVIFCDISKRYKRVINQQLRCDSILFNGIECIREENISSESVANSDVCDINVTLIETHSNNYQNNIIQ